VRRLASFVAVLIMFVMMLPALACAATPMTHMESDCCQQMHGKCGDMAKQGCCHVDVRSDLQQLPSRVTTVAILPITTIAVLYLPTVKLPASSAHAWHVPDEYSPPGLLVASTIVLRI
jgi:hypothetical protein